MDLGNSEKLTISIQEKWGHHSDGESLQTHLVIPPSLTLLCSDSGGWSRPSNPCKALYELLLPLLGDSCAEERWREGKCTSVGGNTSHACALTHTQTHSSLAAVEVGPGLSD